MPVDLGPHENTRIDSLADTGRLRWVLEFTRRDLDTVTAEVLETIGDDLRHATVPWWLHKRTCTTMPAIQVRALQQEIRQGIHAILGESIPFVDTVMATLGHRPQRGVWDLPSPTTYLVRVPMDRAGRNCSYLACR
jgi:hypothetical protein